MNCRDVKALSHAYADHELDLVRSTEIEEHLTTCRSCSREVANIRSISSALKSSTFYFRAPANLGNRIRQSTCARNGTVSLRRRPEVHEMPWKQWMRWLIPVTASAVLLLLAISAVPTADKRLTGEVVSSHIRSMMADHLTDVASSDQHTVKPWFDGKIDFAPPVINLAERGFPLIGGRLDYLQNQPVAAEVYQRNKHIINLFVWPSAQNRNSSKTANSKKGYNVISWEQAGMNYCAVSDLNAVELREFADLLQ
jgi:anti-sigma factor RsiW